MKTRLLLLLPLLLATPAPAQILSIGAELQVPASAAGFQAAPATAVAPSGGSLVVWQSAGSGEQETDVFARAFGPDGAPLGPEFLVNSYLPGCQQSPDVAAAPDGSFTVVWQSEEQDGNGSGVFFRRFSAEGTALTVNAHEKPSKNRPSGRRLWRAGTGGSPGPEGRCGALR